MQTPTTYARLGLIGLPMALTMALVSAQTPTTQDRPAPNLLGQAPVFRSGVNHVQTDVKVFDSKHQFVSDMKPDEFQVLEDGVPQKVTEWFASAGGRVLSSWLPPAPVLTEGVMLPPPPPRQLGGRLFVIFIDDMHIQPLDSPKVKQVLHILEETLLHPDDLISIVSTGYSSCESDAPDHDLYHRKLDDCVAQLMGSAASPSEIINMPETSQGLAELHHKMNTAFRTAYDILDQLESITEKRKAFIWISEGYDLNPFSQARLQHEQDLYNAEFGDPTQSNTVGQTDGSGTATAPAVLNGVDNSAVTGQGQSLAGNPFVDPFSVVSGQFSESELISQMAELIRAANRANTKIYTVDPRGLSAGPPLDVNISASDWDDYLTTSISGLRAIAEETGGFAGVNRNDFQKIFREIDNDSSDYYTLGWDSTNPDPLHRVRKVEIKVTRPGVSASGYKTMYTLNPRQVKLPARSTTGRGRGGGH